MEIFLAVVMGCSDDFSLCDRVFTREVAARSADACAELILDADEVARISWPSVRAECHALEEPAMEVADASR